jgi:hypothetical protein
MTRSIFTFIALILLCGCTDEVANLLMNEDDQNSCETFATVRDITGLDACSGFVFELEDGSRLRPMIGYFCGTPPVSEDAMGDNPLAGFEFLDGKQAWINYEIIETDFADACMAGQYARITCLTEVVSPNDTR